MAQSSNLSSLFIVYKDKKKEPSRFDENCCELLRIDFEDIEYTDVYFNIESCDYSEMEVIKWVKVLNSIGFKCEYVGNHDDHNRNESFVVRNSTRDKKSGVHYLATHTGIRYLYTPLFQNLVRGFFEYKSEFPNDDVFIAIAHGHLRSTGMWDSTFSWFKSQSNIVIPEYIDFDAQRVQEMFANNPARNVGRYSLPAHVTPKQTRELNLK